MKSILNMLGAVLLVALGFVLVTIMNRSFTDKENRLSLKYQMIEKSHGVELMARFISYDNATLRGGKLFNFSNNTYLFIGSATTNYAYDSPMLMRFFQQNDSIFKRANSDTLYVYRGEQEYYFIIGKIINKK